RMWEAAATAANVATLRERGVNVLEPGEGQLASRGERGPGRLPEPEAVLTAIEAAVGATADLADRRVLVTAGGTREPIDPVRFIGNRSSGRMGVALAEAAARRGAAVTLIAANVALPAPAAVERIDVTSAAELEAATAREFAAADVLLMAAAVADFRPADPSAAKFAREGEATPTVELEATADVLAGLAGRRRDGQVLVGFAAEHGGDYVARARDKLERKGVDAIVVNDVSDPSIGFESTENEVTVVTAAEDSRLPRGSKRELADAILDRVVALHR
ncbi:MAG TPA: bifunctional phosphopantothenoylcysteine decarboxylase/phosphopantothenate--cysteine ligase CoaBC, partial [Solirubrobacterales bacterium]|nr:bifunctional phosphopantothenoylcysteine decarboxylase/phosphopantothenate--cysteine ligase CoaBC [Solirubrobacterales bacterium]